MNTKKLETVSFEVTLGYIAPEELPKAAIDAMENGLDSPSLRILAGLSKADLAEIKLMFDRALNELNIPKPSRRDAVLHLARKTANEILRSEIDPYQGAKRIWELSLRIPDEIMPELDSFIYAASEWEDRPEDRNIFEDGIIAAAKDLTNQ